MSDTDISLEIYAISILQMKAQLVLSQFADDTECGNVGLQESRMLCRGILVRLDCWAETDSTRSNEAKC